MKDAVATMGNILPPDAGGRDAVHVAVFSATSHEQLFPSQHVAIAGVGDGQDKRVSATAERGCVGIVDPFLRSPVTPGQRVWVYLYPRTITALSHRWSHPAFEAVDSSYVPPSAKLQSEQWLRDFVNRSDCPSYEKVVSVAEDFLSGRNDGDDEYLLVSGQDAHGEIPPEFWQHIEVVLGRPVPPKCPTYFSCSC